jgi:hypothetical protein
VFLFVVDTDLASRYKYNARLKDRSLADQGLKFCFQDLIGRGTEYFKAYLKVEVRPLPCAFFI